MTLADLMPVRITHLKFERAARKQKHRAADEVLRLRHLLDGAHALIAGLQLQIDTKDRDHAETTAKQAAAEELVVQLKADVDDLTDERKELRDEVLMFRARFGAQLAAEANATAVTVPPMVRPIDGPEDQATSPIDVRPLWDALGIGPTAAVTDPGHATTH